MQNYMADPLSIKQIRELTEFLRDFFNLNTEETKEFPIVRFMEWTMPKIFEDFTICIETKEAMGNIHGLACPEDNCIRIREDVYERAILGYGRDRFTLAHELGHYFLHDSSHVKLARLGKDNTVEAFRNPEWQANTFAAELLMPINLINSNNPSIIAQEFGVSYSAAKVRIKKIYKQ